MEPMEFELNDPSEELKQLKVAFTGNFFDLLKQSYAE